MNTTENKFDKDRLRGEFYKDVEDKTESKKWTLITKSVLMPEKDDLNCTVQ